MLVMSTAQPISFFSILSSAQYWVRSTDHLALASKIEYGGRNKIGEPQQPTYSDCKQFVQRIKGIYLETNYHLLLLVILLKFNRKKISMH